MPTVTTMSGPGFERWKAYAMKRFNLTEEEFNGKQEINRRRMEVMNSDELQAIRDWSTGTQMRYWRAGSYVRVLLDEVERQAKLLVQDTFVAAEVREKIERLQTELQYQHEEKLNAVANWTLQINELQAMNKQMETWQGKQCIGFGLWRAQWHSICSKHQKPRLECKTCCSGNYSNNFIRKIDHFVYVHWRHFWSWKHNPHLRQKWTLKLRKLS